MKFETDGVTYNLGVIDNKQTGNKDPINDEDINISINKSGKIILSLLLLLLLLILLAPLLPAIINILLWIILLPFKLIAAIRLRSTAISPKGYFFI